MAPPKTYAMHLSPGRRFPPHHCREPRPRRHPDDGAALCAPRPIPRDAGDPRNDAEAGPRRAALNYAAVNVRHERGRLPPRKPFSFHVEPNRRSGARWLVLSLAGKAPACPELEGLNSGHPLPAYRGQVLFCPVSDFLGANGVGDIPAAPTRARCTAGPPTRASSTTSGLAQGARNL